MKKRNYGNWLGLLFVVLLMVSCSDNNDTDTNPTSKTLVQRLKNTVNAARAANSSTSSDDDSTYDDDYGDDCMEEFECFEFVFPLTIIQTDGSQITIADEDALFDFFDAQEDDYEPNFVFPISLDFGDGEVLTINSLDELDEAFDLCEDDFECFELTYPITMIDEAGNNVVINSEEELFAFFDAQSDDYEPAVVYPIDVIVGDETISITSDDEMEELYEACDDDWDDVMCFDMVYPFDMVSNGTTVTITDEDAFFTFIDSLTDDQEVDFVYPLTVIDEESGDTITVSNLDQLESLFDDCNNDWDDDDFED